MRPVCYNLKLQKKRTITGCVTSGQNGMTVTDEKDKQVYALSGDTTGIKPGDRVTWKDGNYPLRTVIWEYAQQHMGVNLGPITEVWRDPVKYKLLQTVVFTMLKEVCEYFCFKLTLKQNLNKLKQYFPLQTDRCQLQY